MLAQPGSINCYVTSRFKWGRKRGLFNGTTRDLSEQAVALGARAGDLVHADFGAGYFRYRLVDEGARLWAVKELGQ